MTDQDRQAAWDRAAAEMNAAASAPKATVTIYIAVNQDGDSQMSWDSASDAIDELRDNYGFEAVRVVTLNVTLDLPVAETVAVEVPAIAQTPAEVTAS